MTKRHTANALYIARCMNRGGYIRGGSPDIPPMEDPRNWLELGGAKPISPSIDQRLGIGTDAGEAVVQPLSGQGMPSRQSQQSPQAVNQLFDSPGMTQWREKSVIPASKVEDRYYTGTSKDKDFPDFNVGRHGAWFTKNPADASMYAQQNDSKSYKRQGWDHVPVNTADRVIPAYLRAENPYTGPLPDIAYAQNYKKAQSDWFDQLRAQGHDAWMPKNAPDLAVILKNPSDIKSAISNSGDFDRGAKRIDRDDGGRAGYFDGGMPEVIDLETETPDAGGYPDVIDLETPMPEGTDTGSSPMSYAPDDEPAEQPSALAAIAKIAPQAKKPVPVEQPYATAPAPMSRADETWGRMLQQESNRQHFDESGRPKISSAGAVGIAQVKPATGKEAAALAGEPWNFKRFHSDPEYNERLGRAYYDQQLQRFGDPTLAAAAYNAGPYRLNRALGLAQSTGRDVSDFLPAETRKYMRGASSFADGGSTDGISIVDAPEQSTEQLPDNAYAALYEPKMVRLAERQPQTDQPASINREYMPFEGVGSVSAGANAGPVRGNVSLSGQHGQTPSYGMNLGLDLPGDLVASYNRSGEAGGRSRDANNALSIAKRVGKSQVGVNTSKSGEAGPRSYGAQFQYPLGNKGGSAGLYADYTLSSKDLRGGVRFQRDFATGGAIADRAIMLLSKKAKRQPGRG